MASIYRRGRTYWARGQRNGREFRESLKTTDRRVAEGRYREWVERLDAIGWGGKRRYTFLEATAKFIGEHLSTLKPASARRYGISLKWLGDRFGSMFLDQIQREQLADFEAYRRAGGASAPTIRRDLACLSSMLSSCEDWGWQEDGRNPVPGFLKRRSKRGLKESPGRTRYLSEEEEARLLAAASPMVREAIIIAIDTGLRREEEFSLTWPQIDLRRGIIATTRRTKSGKARSVPLPARVAQILAQWRSSPAMPIASLYVIHHEDGSRLLQMDKGLKGAARRAGIKDLRWHDLRRTAGCRWLQRDRLSMEEVSTLLGHSSVAVTEKSYAFLDSEKVAEDAAQMPAHGRVDYGTIGKSKQRLGQ